MYLKILLLLVAISFAPTMTLAETAEGDDQSNSETVHRDETNAGSRPEGDAPNEVDPRTRAVTSDDLCPDDITLPTQAADDGSVDLTLGPVNPSGSDDSQFADGGTADNNADAVNLIQKGADLVSSARCTKCHSTKSAADMRDFIANGSASGEMNELYNNLPESDKAALEAWANNS